MHSMRPAVARARRDLLGLDRLHQLRVSRVGLGIENVDARRAQPRHHQVAPLDMRMRCVGTQRGAARVPAKVMQLVAGIRHLGAPDDLRVGFRFRIEIEHAQRVMLAVARRRIEGDDVAELLARRLHRHSRRRVECLIGFPQRHEFAPPSAGCPRPYSTRPNLKQARAESTHEALPCSRRRLM